MNVTKRLKAKVFQICPYHISNEKNNKTKHVSIHQYYVFIIHCLVSSVGGAEGRRFELQTRPTLRVLK